MRGLPSFLTFVLVHLTETGNYTYEFCGKQYKYYTPYQEHVALHAPISEYLLQGWPGAHWHLQGLWGAPGWQERLHSWGSFHWSCGIAAGRTWIVCTRAL